LHIEYLQTIFFILVIASLVQFVEMFIQKFSPPLYHALGIYLPLITTNCAVLGVTIINVREAFTFAQSLCNALGAGFGFTLALLLMAAIRERLQIADVPKPFVGIPITFICAALMSLAFMGFAGLVK
jgi:electron transport complex protein RnfA